MNATVRATLSSITLLLLLSTCSLAQFDPNIWTRGECLPTASWMPVGMGLPYAPQAAAVFDDRLYVASGYPERTGYIAYWDGARWSEVTRFTGSGWIMSILKFKGEIYITGNLGRINGISGTETMARWDGVAWHRVGEPSATEPLYSPDSTDVVEYNGALYTYGTVTDTSGKSIHAIIAWDGTRWRTVAPLKESAEGPYFISSLTSMKVWNGMLCIAGYFSEIDGKPVADTTSTFGTVATWDGSRWTEIGAPPVIASTLFGMKLLIYRQDLYALLSYTWPSGLRTSTTERLFRWNGGAWLPTGAFDGKDSSGAAIRGANALGISFDRSILTQYGDELCGIFDIGAYGGLMLSAGYAWNGAATRYLPRLNLMPFFLTEYHGELYAGGDFTSSCGRPVRSIAKLCEGSACGNEIAGTVFNDRDSNCTYSFWDSRAPVRIVELTPGPLYAMTDSNGIYGFHAPAGAYSLRLLPSPGWREECPARTSHAVSVTSTDSLIAGLDFPSRIRPDAPNYHVALMAGSARPGGYLQYIVTVTNLGGSRYDGAIRLAYNPALTPDASRMSGARLLDSAVEWRFESLYYTEAATFIAWMKVPDTMAAGRELCAHVEARPDSTNIVLTASACGMVRNSIASQQILVSPGKGDRGEIEPKDSILTYTISFQNSGTASALRVVVIDTLDPRLDPGTVTPGSASHPYRFAIEGRGILRWELDGIDLPTKASNEKESYGMVTFSVHLRSGLPVGTTIANRAGIFFDFNDPIVTGPALSTIVGPASVARRIDDAAIVLFPNPAHGELEIEGAIPSGAEITLRDILGAAIRQYRTNVAGPQRLDLTGLPAGTYLLEIPTMKGMAVERVVVR